MTSESSAVFNLIASLFGTACYFLVGWLWSTSTWQNSFDLGWLVVAWILARYITTRIEKAKLKAKEYITLCLPALPGFFLEFLADWALHDFRHHERLGSLVLFAISSCSLLMFVVALTAFVRFGVGLDVISAKDERSWRTIVWVGASAITVSLLAGTTFVVALGAKELAVRQSALQEWFYWTSLIVYLLLTLKVMLPLVLRRWRAVTDLLHQPDMRF